MVLLPLYCGAQNIQITFTASGESNVVDSVTATNLTTFESVTLPGNETLILEQSSVGSMPLYKQLKAKNPKFNTFDFRVMQYREFF